MKPPPLLSILPPVAVGIICCAEGSRVKALQAPSRHAVSLLPHRSKPRLPPETCSQCTNGFISSLKIAINVEIKEFLSLYPSLEYTLHSGLLPFLPRSLRAQLLLFSPHSCLLWSASSRHQHHSIIILFHERPRFPPPLPTLQVSYFRFDSHRKCFFNLVSSRRVRAVSVLVHDSQPCYVLKACSYRSRSIFASILSTYKGISTEKQAFVSAVSHKCIFE